MMTQKRVRGLITEVGLGSCTVASHRRRPAIARRHVRMDAASVTAQPLGAAKLQARLGGALQSCASESIMSKSRRDFLITSSAALVAAAVVPELLEEDYPFSTLKGGANVLIFPDLGSANIAYKLMLRIGGAEALGPILVGMSKPVHVLQRGATVEEIVNMAAIAVAHARVVAHSLKDS